MAAQQEPQSEPCRTFELACGFVTRSNGKSNCVDKDHCEVCKCVDVNRARVFECKVPLL